MSRIVYILNGPNLNLLGQREPAVYGHETLADIEANCQEIAKGLKLEVEFHQSNAEHQLIDWIHQARTSACAIIINPAAFTHTSIAIHDALRTCDFPVIEVHLSNPHAREEFRHISYVSMLATSIIAGCGGQGYTLALQRVAKLVE